MKHIVICTRAKLQKINNGSTKFRISFVSILIEHVSIILLAVMLFLAFCPYHIILAVVWAIFRIEEGLFKYILKKDYWNILNITRKYSGTSGAQKSALIDLVKAFLKQKTLFSRLHKSYSQLVRSHTQANKLTT